MVRLDPELDINKTIMTSQRQLFVLDLDKFVVSKMARV